MRCTFTASLRKYKQVKNKLRLFWGKERKSFNLNLLENKSDSPVLQENVDQMVTSLRTLTLLIAQLGDAFLSDSDLIGWDKEKKKKKTITGCWTLLLCLPAGQTQAKSNSPSADCPTWVWLLSCWLGKIFNHQEQYQGYHSEASEVGRTFGDIIFTRYDTV